jgi:predicted O-methyltransferase YrrM
VAKFIKGCSQYQGEIAWFCELLKREGCKSYLEIGSLFGGSLWRVGSVLPRGSKVVSVDLPSGQPHDPGDFDSLKACAAKLAEDFGHDSHVIEGDSTDKFIVERVEPHGPFDACFIDANHTLSYVTKDWENYGPLCRIVAFHDINWKRDPGTFRRRVDVPVLWEQLKKKYRFEEIREGKQDNGIGVLWRW